MKGVIKGILSIFLVITLSLGIYIAYYNSTELDKQIKYKEIIQRELKETGKLVVLEGTTQYVETQEETKKLPGISIEIGNRTLNLDLQFKYGYSVDLSAIKVDVSNDIVLIVDSRAMILDYVYLDTDKSSVESTASLLVKSYTLEEINDIQKSCTQNVRDELYKNEENILKARESLEKQLNIIIGKVTNTQAIIRYE